MEDRLANSLASVMLEEHADSMKKYGKHHSPYEAYAVILEEMQEFKFAYDRMDKSIELFWLNTMNGDLDNRRAIRDIYAGAIRAASELVQIAATAFKCMDGYTRDEEAQDVSGDS